MVSLLLVIINPFTLPASEIKYFCNGLFDTFGSVRIKGLCSFSGDNKQYGV